MKRKIPLLQAQVLAGNFVAALSPFCRNVAVAGSVRREEPEVGDIEIVLVPDVTEVPGLFGPMQEDALKSFPWKAWGKVIKDGERYKQIETRQGVALDIFIVRPPAQWGVIFMMRTGPEDFSQWMVTPRRKGGGLPSYLRVHAGAIWQGEQRISTPTEGDVFRLLGVDYIPPQERKHFIAKIKAGQKQAHQTQRPRRQQV